jgi:hypothetical protein
MILVAKILFWWTLADFVIGIPLWAWLKRNSRRQQREAEFWLHSHPDMGLERMPDGMMPPPFVFA